MGTCSGDSIDCVSGVSMPQVLEGEGRVSRESGWGGGRRQVTWPGSERGHTLLIEDEELDNTERACDTLLMCIVTVMNHGLRNGGGVGDILRKPSKDVSTPAPLPDPRGPSPGRVGSCEGPALRLWPGRAAWPLQSSVLKALHLYPHFPAFLPGQSAVMLLMSHPHPGLLSHPHQLTMDAPRKDLGHGTLPRLGRHESAGGRIPGAHWLHLRGRAPVHSRAGRVGS